MASPQAERSVPRTQVLGNSDLRRHNLSAVLRAIHACPGSTRGEIVAVTGLTKTAVSDLVSQLVGIGVVVEEPPQARVGRPSSPLRLATERYAVAVVDIGKTVVGTTVSDLAGTVLGQVSAATVATPGVGNELALEQVDGVLQRGSSPQLVAVVVVLHNAIPSPTGSDEPDPAYPGSVTVDQLRERLGSGADLLIVENDANLAALAEWRRWSSTGLTSLISLSGELSVGAGLVIDGKLHRGARGRAGSVSHMSLAVDHGEPCGCGRRGCWSGLIGLRSILRRALPELAAGLEAIPGYAPIAVESLVAAARAGNARVVDELAQTGRWIGEGAANLMNVFDPDLIILGGAHVPLREWILPSAHEALGRGSVSPVDPGAVMLTSDLAAALYHVEGIGLERSRAVGGGLEAATERLLADPLRWARRFPLS